MTKDELLAELKGNTYVMIRPSPIEGIGVFAIRDIPKGCRNMFSAAKTNGEEWLTIPRTEIDLLPASSKRLIETYCLYDDENYFVPEYGFKKMDLVNFLNHSETPNVISINDGEFFEAIRDIQSGEELVIDYGEIVGGE
ncbi:MAG: SET domain-containing protein-lysine N-methyltransferase [Ferruginibacter sp.]